MTACIASIAAVAANPLKQQPTWKLGNDASALLERRCTTDKPGTCCAHKQVHAGLLLGHDQQQLQGSLLLRIMSKQEVSPDFHVATARSWLGKSH